MNAEAATGYEVAIIGMSGRFPRANSVAEFLDLLREGREGSRELSDAELVEAGSSPELISRPNYVKRAAYVEGKGLFDADLFRYNAHDAAVLDPQVSMFHECVWEALEHAGYNGDGYEGLIGLFAGAGRKVKLPVEAVGDDQSFAENFNNYTLAETDFLCSRVAHKLNFKGPVVRVATACSTSLVAVHLACQSLIVGESDLALAGGVSIHALSNTGYLYHPDMILSPDGHCRAFDQSSGGTFVGEGCGVVVLKLLEKAVEDGDNVLAVIRASAVNNDGQQKVGYAAPSVEGQVAVIRSALARAEIPPETVSYIEAHGTGTRLGDSVEIEALADAYRFPPDTLCKIGSVKSNIGHLDVAAGAAGLIKTVLSLQHRCLFPSLHFTRPNPNIDFERARLAVNTELSHWPNGTHPRRAAVSSFGIGGTNAHVILEEFTQARPSGPSRKEQLLCLSANSAGALQRAARSLSAVLDESLPLADVCYTLHRGRRALPYRMAWAARDVGELRQQLTQAIAADLPAINDKRKLCFLFPGQGSQHLNMGRGLYENEAFFRARVDECFAIADALGHGHLRGVLFSEHLEETRHAQPLLFIIEHALAKTLMHWGCEPDAMIGHSLGEYVAACLSGVFSLRDALAVVIARGELMQAAPAGSMLSVFLTEEELRPLLPDTLSIAAINREDRVVVSGETPVIEQLRQRLERDGIPSSLLHTSHAFHSAMMEGVRPAFARALERTVRSAPGLPYVSNLTGQWADAEAVASASYWADHLRQPVRFGASIEFLSKQHDWLFVEVGPGDALTQLVGQDARLRERHVALSTLGKRSSRTAQAPTLAEALGQLYRHGVALDWERYYEGERRNRVALPTYAFDKKSYYPTKAGEPAPRAAPSPSPAPGGMELPPNPSAKPRPASLGEYIAPRTETQSALVEIWGKFLGVQALGIKDDLFSLGVDSLLSIRVITEIRKRFSVEIALDRMFAMASIEEQAEEIIKLRSSGATEILPDIVATPHGGKGVLSSSQKRLWVVSHLEAEVSAYNSVLFFHVPDLNVATLRRTFEEILRRHAILRTVYGLEGDTPCQYILEEYTFDFTRFDFSALAEEERKARTQEIVRGDILRKFDLSKELMIRVSLIKTPGGGHDVLVTQHHITFDNWTTNLFLQELNQIYDAFKQGKPSPLPEPTLQYIDYAIWQEAWLKSESMRKMLRYWKRTLDGIPQLHSLPLDKVRPPRQDALGEQVHFDISKELTERLVAFNKSHGVTMFMTLQAAFAVLLSRYSGEDDIVVGFPVANRPLADLNALMGMFVNTLVLRSDLSADPLFTEFLARTKEKLTSAYANQAFPFETLVEELNPERSLSYEPVAQVRLTMLNQDMGQEQDWYAQNNARTFAPLPGELPYSKLDLTLFVSQTPNGITASWEYATSLFHRETIQRMAESFSVLLESIVRNPNRPISRIPVFSERERRRLLLDFNHLKLDGGAGSLELPDLLGDGRQGGRARAEKNIDFSLFFFANDIGDKADDKYRLLVEGAKFADTHELTAVWTPERHFDTFGGRYPNPTIAAAVLAGVTRNIGLRAGSCVLPLHNPVRLVEDWSVIDNVSHGRVGIGIAAGFHPRDFTLAPDVYAQRQEKMLADAATIRALWRGESVQLRGGTGELESVSIRPLPVQAEVPLWLTTTGNIHSFRRAGELGINVLTHLLGQTPRELEAKIAAYREAWKAAGHAGSGYVSVLVHAFVSEDPNYVLEQVKEPFKNYLKESAGSPQFLQKHLGVNAQPNQQEEDVGVLIERAFNRYYQTSALLGTPESCEVMVKELESAGVNEVACLIDFGVPESVVLDNLVHLDRLRQRCQRKKAALTPGALVAEQDLPVSKTWVELFMEQVARAPDRLAVVRGDQRLSYRELYEQAVRRAATLRQMGIGREDLVALLDHRGIDLLVMIIAVLQAGAAYVPLDPTQPEQRWLELLGDARPKLLVVGNGLSPRAQVGAGRVIRLEELGLADDAAMDWELPGLKDLSYVMYASNTPSGEPRGVMVEHAGLVNDVLTKTGLLGLSERDVVAQTASQCSSVSVFQWLGALLSGGAVAIIPDEVLLDPRSLPRELNDQRVSVWVAAPSQLHAVLPLAPPLPALRWVISTGEALGAPLVEQWFARYPDVPLVNAYGLAECSGVVAAEVMRGPVDKVLIGQAVPNVRLHVLDDALALAPIGAGGELAVAGLAVGRGYLNRPELTEKAFIENPYSLGETDQRLYLTGDLVRRHADGRIEFVGRKERQVRVRGARVDLGEIERRLVECEGVSQAVVGAVESGVAGRQLVAYVTTTRPVSWDDMRLVLRAKLPEYMVPAQCMTLERVPLSAHGKIDRERLPIPERGAWERGEHLAPVGPVETVIAEVWRAVLGGSRVGRHDNFFDLGGNSLLAITMIGQLKAQGLRLDLADVYQLRTVSACAAAVNARRGDRARWPLDERWRHALLAVGEGARARQVLLLDAAELPRHEELRSLLAAVEPGERPAFVRYTEDLAGMSRQVAAEGIAALSPARGEAALLDDLRAQLQSYRAQLAGAAVVELAPFSPIQVNYMTWKHRESIDIIRLEGLYAPEELQAAFGLVAAEQDMLRGAFDGEAPRWRLLDPAAVAAVNVPFLDLSGEDPVETEALLRALGSELFTLQCQATFPLPYVAAMVSLSDLRHMLLFAVDHLIWDGISKQVILRRLQERLRGVAPGAIQRYRDYSEASRRVPDEAAAAKLRATVEPAALRDVMDATTQALAARAERPVRVLQLRVPAPGGEAVSADHSFGLFKRCVARLTGLERFGMVLNHLGRDSAAGRWFDQTGLFVDKVPFAAEAGTTLRELASRAEQLQRQGINYVGLSQVAGPEWARTLPAIDLEVLFNFQTTAPEQLMAPNPGFQQQALAELRGILFEAAVGGDGHLRVLFAFRGDEGEAEAMRRAIMGE